MISGLAATCVVASWPANPRTAPFTPEYTKASVAALQLGGFAGTPVRAAARRHTGALAGLARKACARASACCDELRVGGGAGRGAPVVRDGVQHALRQRGELSRLRHGDPDRRLGNVVVPGDQRGDARERRGVARPVEERRRGRAVRATVGANVGSGGGCGYCTKTRLNESRAAVRDAARRRPRRRHELLRGLRVREHEDALAHDDAPVGGAEEHAVPRRRAFAPTAASTSAAFEHDCFSASV